MNGARFGNAVHVGPPAATARPLRNALPPRLPPASPSRRPPHNTYYTVLAHYIITISSVVSTNFLARILSISMRKVWTYSLAQKHGFEEICRPNDRINVAYCNALFMYKPLTVFNNLLSIGNFVTKIILGLLKYYRMCR